VRLYEKEVEMCEFMLCLELRDSLDAAFGGGAYAGSESIGAWGRAVVNTLQKYRPECRHPNSLIWQIGHSNLQSMIMNCPCEGAAESILHNPEGFLRTILILASRKPLSRNPRQSVVLH
jgi:hypothetical protein